MRNQTKKRLIRFTIAVLIMNMLVLIGWLIYITAQDSPQARKVKYFENHRTGLLTEANNVIDNYNLRMASKYLNMLPTEEMDAEANEARSALTAMSKIWSISTNAAFGLEIKEAMTNKKRHIPLLCDYAEAHKQLVQLRPMVSKIRNEFEYSVRWCEVDVVEQQRSLAETYRHIAASNDHEIKNSYEQLALIADKESKRRSG